MVPELDKFLLPSKVFTFNGTKVGVVGYLTTETPVPNIKFYNLLIIVYYSALDKSALISKRCLNPFIFSFEY